MSPRQLLRLDEIRSVTRRIGQKTERDVRRYPDAAGSFPEDGNLEDHLDAMASRIRLNAGALDWRQPPASGVGGPGGAAQLTTESPDGIRDGLNTTFRTSASFVPQSMKFFVNGLRQQASVSDESDFSMSESSGLGTGYDTLVLAWAPLPQDQLMVDYQQTSISGD